MDLPGIDIPGDGESGAAASAVEAFTTDTTKDIRSLYSHLANCITMRFDENAVTIGELMGDTPTYLYLIVGDALGIAKAGVTCVDEVKLSSRYFQFDCIAQSSLQI